MTRSTPGAPQPIPSGAGRRTSLSHPLYLDWLDLGRAPRFAGFTGRLGMTILPGKYHPGGRGGDHDRDLELDAARLAEVYGVTTFVLLVEGWELEASRVPAFIPVLARHGITVRHYPMIDHQTPRDRAPLGRPGLAGMPAFGRFPEPGDLGAFDVLLAGIEARLAAGEILAMSCRGGIGRTGLTAACLLIRGGLDAESAMAVTRSSRAGTIDHVVQEAFVRSWSPV